MTGHWEPEFLLFAWRFKYLFSASNTNKVINVIKCSFLNLFVDILFLTVNIHLPLHLYMTHFFASGQTCEIGTGSNTYFPHCTCTMCLQCWACVCMFLTCMHSSAACVCILELVFVCSSHLCVLLLCVCVCVCVCVCMTARISVCDCKNVWVCVSLSASVCVCVCVCVCVMCV